MAALEGIAPVPDSSSVYRLIDVCDALALRSHRNDELDKMHMGGNGTEAQRERLELWNAVFGGDSTNGIDTTKTVPAALVQDALAELHRPGDDAIQSIGNWLERWGHANRRGYSYPRPLSIEDDMKFDDDINSERKRLPAIWWERRSASMNMLAKDGIAVPTDMMNRLDLNRQWEGKERVTHAELVGWMSLTRPRIALKQEPEQPTIWYHGARGYSADRNTPLTVSQEQNNILTVFLEEQTSFDTQELEEKSGVTSAARVVKELADNYPGFAPAIRRPGREKVGYFIRVQRLKP